MGEDIASGAVQEQVSATAAGQEVAVAERGVEVLAPAFVPDELELKREKKDS